MAWTIQCQRSEDVAHACCSGDGITESFTGLLITEDGGAQTRIRVPYLVYTGSNYAMVADHQGAYKKILVSNTTYGTVSELKAVLNACKSDRWLRETFEGATGTSVTVTANGGVLPVDTSLVLVYLNGQLLSPTDDYTISGSTINFTFDLNGGLVQVLFLPPNG